MPVKDRVQGIQIQMVVVVVADQDDVDPGKTCDGQSCLCDRFSGK
jgi:hypothetical protein